MKVHEGHLYLALLGGALDRGKHVGPQGGLRLLLLLLLHLSIKQRFKRSNVMMLSILKINNYSLILNVI